MKAPNGQPTKLTERQWVQVRTPAFKAWFGDWEKVDKKQRLEGTPIMSVKSSDIPIKDGNIISTAIKWIEENPQDVVNTVIGEVEITRRGIRDDFSHVAFPNKLAVLPSVKSVLEKGVYLGEIGDLNGKNVQNYYFAAPVLLDGDKKIVFVRIRKKGEGSRRFYVHDVYTLDEIKKSGSIKTTGTMQTAQNKGTVPDFYKSILHEILSVNPDSVSKVVDENGEPLVVYHGTTEKFNVFKNKGKKTLAESAKLAFWFSESKLTGKEYSQKLDLSGNKESLKYEESKKILRDELYEKIKTTRFYDAGFRHQYEYDPFINILKDFIGEKMLNY